MTTPRTRDGVEFRLGMTLWSSAGPMPTSPETHEIRALEVSGVSFPTIGRRDGVGWTGVSMFYSSEAARLRGLIADLEDDRDEIQSQIDELKRELRSLES